MLYTKGTEDKIFHFNDKPALQVQSDGDCEDLFVQFGDTPSAEASGDLQDDLQAIAKDIEALQKKYDVTWLAKYGCAILVGHIEVMSRSIAVVALDGWKTIIHASVEHGRESTAIPDIVSPSYLEAGHIPYDKVKEVVADMRGKLAMAAAAQQRTSQKDHKTPSFVWAKLLNAMSDLKLISVEQVSSKLGCYQGGTTDVGLHTACLRRNTSFPLVASVYAKMFYLSGDRQHQRFVKVLCIFFLRHLR